MKTNVLPLVIENLLKAAKISCAGLEVNGHVFARELKETIEAVKQYKKQLEQDDLITLHFASRGDRSVGINGQSLDITMWAGLVRPDEKLREQVKELFADSVSELFDEPISSAHFSDECPDCNKPLYKSECENKDCPINAF